MKREIVGKGTVESPAPLKSVEREFAAAIQYMIDQMAQRYRSQIFNELNKSTVDKFEDAQTGNFAAIFLKMAEKVRRKLTKQFDDGRLEKLAKTQTGKVDKRNKAEFYKRIEKRVGINREELEASEGLTSQINAFSLETFQWIKKIRDETMQDWTANTLRMMAEGNGLPEIMSQFDDMVEKRKGHAKMVARTQISTFNSLTSKARAQNLGIERAVWVTSKDERVRASHAARDGKEFDLSEGLYSALDGKTLIPGNFYNCRCISKFIIPED